MPAATSTLFTFSGVNFEFCFGDYSKTTTKDCVIILKPIAVVSRYAALLKSPAPRILELGIFEAGSAVLLALMVPSAKIVAIDSLNKPYLNDVIAHLGLQDRIKLYHETLQQDRDQLRSIVYTEFGNEALDLIIDDASHMYSLSRRSFEVLFPFLGKNQHYVLEDWNWAHYPGVYQESKWLDEPALTNLAFELAMVAGSMNRQISSIELRDISAIVQKASDYDPAFDFVIDNKFRNRSKSITLI